MRLILLGGFTLFWLIPFFWTGRMGSMPFRIPSRLLTQYACAGLFTKRTWTWNQPLVQIQHEKNGAWKTVKMTELSPLGAYGYRQRIDRLLLKIGRSKTPNKIHERLALWIAQQYKLTHPERGEVVGVRYAQNVWPVNCPELTQPKGHWEPTPSELGPNGRFNVLGTFELRDDKATLLGATNGAPKELPMPRVFARPNKATATEAKSN